MNEGAKYTTQDEAKLIAFYLPQFHRIPENSLWWSPGFTEWTNVARAKPNFDGHYQPHIPRELGFYDLSYVETIAEQAEIARKYGIYGFCFHHYWFSGRKILDKPLDNLLNSNVDIKFCLCWANENWTRTWDGNEKDVLLRQNYSNEDKESFIDSLICFFEDNRYIRVDGNPIIIVYRVKEIPDPKGTFMAWRKRAEAHGFPGLHIIVVDFHDVSSPDECGADALVEFPPHKFNGPQSRPAVLPALTNKNFTGGFVDYLRVIAQSANRDVPPFRLYRGIMPSWDNTARRQDRPAIVVNSNPATYELWLRYLRDYTRMTSHAREDNFIFVNAWNEWAEGCHLEPDLKWGLSYLEATLSSGLSSDSDGPSGTIIEARRRLFANLVKESVKGGSQFQDGLPRNLIAYRGVGGSVHRVEGSLRRFPVAHKFAKLVYRSYQNLKSAISLRKKR